MDKPRHIEDIVLERGVWARNMLSLALMYGTFSKDPSTKVGCIIFDAKKRIVGGGCNGFSRNSPDSSALFDDRDKKYARVIHAEENTLFNAVKSVEGCTAILTHPPCLACLHKLDTNGIKDILFVEPRGEFRERWSYEEVAQEAEDLEVGLEMISADSMEDIVDRWHLEGIFTYKLEMNEE